ncbi:cysteine-rich repeat secretory protein 55-like [Wolffia australiana]
MALPASSFPTLLFFLFLISHPRCEAAESFSHYCSYNRPTTPAISKSIAKVLSALVSKNPPKRLNTVSFGGGKSKVFGLAQCHRDINATECKSCIEDATAQLPHLCPGQADAGAWFDHCFVAYDHERVPEQHGTGF